MKVGGAVVRSTRAEVPPGVLVEADVGAGTRVLAAQPITVVCQGADFWVVVKPAGWPSHRATQDGPDARALVAETLGLASEERVWPAHRLDADVGGLWLVAGSQAAAARLSGRFSASEVDKRYRALAPSPPWPEGTITTPLDDRPAETRYRVIQTQGAVSLVEITLITGRTHQIRRHFAEMGCPILGDPLYSGRMVAGGLRLASTGLAITAEDLNAATDPAPMTWPAEPVFPSFQRPPTLTVSAATLRAMHKGHPWVLTDTETGDAGRFAPGTVVTVAEPRGQPGPLAVVEGEGVIAARAWASAGKGKPKSVEARVSAAINRRRSLLDDEHTDAFRLVHGQGDQLPGLFVDRLGPAIRVLITGRAALASEERALAVVSRLVADSLGEDAPIIRVVHLTDRPAGQFHSVSLVSGDLERWLDDSGRLHVRERGLSFGVDLGLGEPYRPRPGVGLFMDQRTNRERVAKVASGRWLNLFCHTGAFSAALLAAGADHVTSVDLSAPYLAELEANLARNGLDASRHRTVRKEARRFVKGLGDERFDGIVVDPPTAARVGKKSWSVRKDYLPLLEALCRLLRPGGALLACRNDRGARKRLRAVVERAAVRAEMSWASLAEAPPGPDFPRLKGFPEGDAFEGVWARR